MKIQNIIHDYKATEDEAAVNTKNSNSALLLEDEDIDKKTNNFYSDLKQSASLRIVTSLLLITLTLFLGLRYLDYKNAKINNDASEHFASVNTETTENEEFIGIININTAGKFELIQLKGIGETKAEAIIEYRKSVGYFKNIEDIMNVKGIGESIFNSIKDNITV